MRHGPPTEKTMRALKFALPALVLLAMAGVLGQGFLHRGAYQANPGAAFDPASAYTDERPNLVAATFYSAWCSACAVLDPKIRAVAPSFDGRAVEFVKLDVSMGQPASLTDRAKALGIEQVYLANKGATGFMALIDRRDQRVLQTITLRQSEADIRASIEAAIRTVSSPPSGT
jgi:thiol-disulfide isomerase/thioredoxin